MISPIERQRLTELASCAGCAAKMGPDRLAQAVLPLTADSHPDLLVGLQTSDDAAVFRMNDQQAIVQTVDFFPPIVDDPFTFGAIAATNAMSDVFAMNGSVLMALSIAAFPESMHLDTITAIFEGAASKVREAGGIIAGGHTILDDEPKFGLSVTGEVHPKRFWTKANAQPGDRLLLTKPLGTGLITTALKNNFVSTPHLDNAVAWMTTLNRSAQQLAAEHDIHACSDVTGFSLAGHAFEIANKSGVRIELSANDLPILDGALDYALHGNIAGGLERNIAYFEGERVTIDAGVSPEHRLLAFDPQTSGGLLLAIGSNDLDGVLRSFEQHDIPIWQVGQITSGTGVHIA